MQKHKRQAQQHLCLLSMHCLFLSRQVSSKLSSRVQVSSKGLRELFNLQHLARLSLKCCINVNDQALKAVGQITSLTCVHQCCPCNQLVVSTLCCQESPAADCKVACTTKSLTHSPLPHHQLVWPSACIVVPASVDYMLPSLPWSFPRPLPPPSPPYLPANLSSAICVLQMLHLHTSHGCCNAVCRWLNLHYCKAVSDKGLRHLASAVQLVHLDIGFCNKVTDRHV